MGCAKCLTRRARGLPPSAMAQAAEGRDAPMLICYDASPEAADAVTYVGDLLPGARAVVVTIWKAIIEELLAGPPDAPPVADPVEANERQHQAALVIAEQGARLASKAGLHAEASVVRATDSIWEAVVEAAEKFDARLIACGTSRSGVAAALPGNLASALVQHASRAVLVVPSAKAAAERRRGTKTKLGARIRG
jgi:nucleotide-binding universal stress UspA family protein